MMRAWVILVIFLGGCIIADRNSTVRIHFEPKIETDVSGQVEGAGVDKAAPVVDNPDQER